jgi:hypothetical protein
VSDTPSQGSCTSSGLQDVGSRADGAQAVLTLDARVLSPNAQTNAATINRTAQFDPDVTNNTASARETGLGVAIDFLPKTHGKGTPHVTPLVVPIIGE